MTNNKLYQTNVPQQICYRQVKYHFISSFIFIKKFKHISTNNQWKNYVIAKEKKLQGLFS